MDALVWVPIIGGVLVLDYSLYAISNQLRETHELLAGISSQLRETQELIAGISSRLDEAHETLARAGAARGAHVQARSEYNPFAQLKNIEEAVKRTDDSTVPGQRSANKAAERARAEVEVRALDARLGGDAATAQPFRPKRRWPFKFT